MLHARSVAVVGASPRADSFGGRMLTELARSPARPKIHLVNPRHLQIDGRPCLPSLEAIEDRVDLVLLGVPDSALAAQVHAAAARGARGAIVFGSAVGLREEIASTARDAGMALCGAGCMGFVNGAYGLRALGYLEPDPLPAGPVALVTHSGSVFSALLRTHRRIGYTLAVSSGQELVTTAADYVSAALALPGTRVIALFLEALRDADRFRAGLAAAAAADVPVVALTVGGSASGRAMVAAHSGAIAGEDAAWEALFDAYGVLRVGDLDEMVDTLELFAAGRRVSSGSGLATVHDSGAERALAVDLATRIGLPFAQLAEPTREKLAGLLDPGLAPENPLDVWGTGADTRTLFARCLQTLHDDPATSALALAVDLVPEFDGDDSYPLAARDVYRATTKPFAVLSTLASAIDPETALALRAVGVPVLEGLRGGLLALRHLLDYRAGLPLPEPTIDVERQARWAARLPNGLTTVEAFALLNEYGIPTPEVRAADTVEATVSAADELGWPVVLKTDAPGVVHKSDVDGVRLDLKTSAEVTVAYREMSRRLGPEVLVSAVAPAGVEVGLGIIRDPQLGPLVVIAAGGLLIETVPDRAVALPPIDKARAQTMLDRLALRPVLDGVRGRQPADLEALNNAIVGLGQLAVELGDQLDAVDLNPVLAGTHGAVAVDVLIERRA